MLSVIRTMIPNRPRISVSLTLVLVLSAIGSSPVWAYVPPASQLLQLMRQALGQTPAATVRQRVSFLDSQGRFGAKGIPEILKYDFPDRFRSDIQSESAQRVHVVSKGRTLTAVNRQIVAEAENRYEFYKDIFLYNSTSLIAQRLASLGVDVSLSSLGRFDGRLVFVVGAKYPDETRSQIWLDKETLRPVRWVIMPSAGVRTAGTLDIRYAQWRQTGELWYPWQVRFYLDKEPVRRIQVEHVDVSGEFPAAIFDIDQLKSSFAPTAATQVKPPPAVGEVQAAIENFRRLYE